jgi:hypothetical protein
MEEKAPETYSAILDADRDSLESFAGHGSAIAQAHSHLILPLANRRDKVTQVRWGIRDFEKRFGRKPEGMWLPETAVDTETLEVLAEEGIAFTILSPYQASEVEGQSSWDEVAGGRVDPTIAYSVSLPSGATLSVFFYDGAISRAVAFEQLLARGDDFKARLKSGFGPDRATAQLVNIATDGETYGHHHRYGDMALAYVLDALEEDPDLHLTNYGEFLALHPAEVGVRIVENSSWSCIHGVERWRADCGCRTGGGHDWNQKWRAPLREALDWLRDSVAGEFERAASELFSDPWEARNRYIDVILDRGAEAREAFFAATSARELSVEERSRALMLMELQRYAMLMYTSCGWFFNDISGIETTQVLQYAARVLQLSRQLFGPDLEPSFLERLALARSNVAERGDGRSIYLRLIRPAIVDLARVGAHYAVSSLFEEYPDRASIYCYEVDRLTFTTLESGHSRLIAGTIDVNSRVTLEHARMAYGLLYLGDVNVSGGVRIAEGFDFERVAAELSRSFLDGDFPHVLRQLDHQFGGLTFSIRSLFRDEQRKILGLIWDSTFEEAEVAHRQLYERYRPLMRFHKDLGVPLPSVLRLTAEAALNIELRHAFEKDRFPTTTIHTLLEEAARYDIPLDAPKLSFALQQTLERLAAQFEEHIDESTLQRLESGIELAGRLPFTVNLWRVQNAYYRALQTREDTDVSLPELWKDRVSRLGEQLSIAPAETPE